MLCFELYKIMVNKVTFIGFTGGDRPPLDPPLGPVDSHVGAVKVKKYFLTAYGFPDIDCLPCLAKDIRLFLKGTI